MNEDSVKNCSPKWDYFYDLVTKFPDQEIDGTPFNAGFPELDDYQTYEVILCTGKIEQAIVDYSVPGKLSWLNMNGSNIAEVLVVAWQEIDDADKEIPIDPALFLDSLQQQALTTTGHLKKLVVEAKLAIRLFKSRGETILFQEEFPAIKGYRYHNVVPKPHYLIAGLEITVKPYHNNNFSKDVYCGVDLRIKLLICHDRDQEMVTFDDNPLNYWNINLESLELSEGEYKEEKLGAITNLLAEHNGSWDSKILISDFSDYLLFKEVLKRGYAAINRPFPEIKAL